MPPLPLFYAAAALPCRPEDAALIAVIDIILILIYMCALLIKSCDLSSVSAGYRAAELRLLRGSSLQQEVARAVCSTYGFGETAEGAAVRGCGCTDDLPLLTPSQCNHFRNALVA